MKGSYRVGHDSTTSEVALLESWERWKADNPGGRSRDAAHALGVSECALVAAQCGDASIRLDGQWEALLRGLEPVGPLMGLTRNEACVIECEGVYERPHFHGSMGQFTGSRVDLRIFLRNWHHGFANRVVTARGEIESLQFFDSDGVAVHKIYLREESDDSAWKSLIERHTASDQTPRLDGMTPDPFATRMGSIPNASANGESDSSGTWADDGVEAASRSLSDERAVRDVESSSSRTELDSAAFLSEWEGMKDTHEFVPLLRRHGLTRRDALELARGRFSREVVLDAALATFAELSRQERKCMVFVANHGCLQIHSGPIRRVVETPGWLNVMDPGFNLHLHRAQATAAYVVRKPTESGTVTSLEIFGADPEPLALLFSYRKGGEEEERGWVDLLAGIPNS